MLVNGLRLTSGHVRSHSNSHSSSGLTRGGLLPINHFTGSKHIVRHCVGRNDACFTWTCLVRGTLAQVANYPRTTSNNTRRKSARITLSRILQLPIRRIYPFVRVYVTSLRTNRIVFPVLLSKEETVSRRTIRPCKNDKSTLKKRERKREKLSA